MSWKIPAMVLGLAVTLTATTADAQRRSIERPVITVRPPGVSEQIDWYDPLRWRPLTPAEEYASSRLVRRCVDGYVLEHRVSGTVLTPRMRCWWAVR